MLRARYKLVCSRGYGIFFLVTLERKEDSASRNLSTLQLYQIIIGAIPNSYRYQLQLPTIPAHQQLQLQQLVQSKWYTFRIEI